MTCRKVVLIRAAVRMAKAVEGGDAEGVPLDADETPSMSFTGFATTFLWRDSGRFGSMPRTVDSAARSEAITAWQLTYLKP